MCLRHVDGKFVRYVGLECFYVMKMVCQNVCTSYRQYNGIFEHYVVGMIEALYYVGGV